MKLKKALSQQPIFSSIWNRLTICNKQNEMKNYRVLKSHTIYLYLVTHEDVSDIIEQEGRTHCSKHKMHHSCKIKHIYAQKNVWSDRQNSVNAYFLLMKLQWIFIIFFVFFWSVSIFCNEHISFLLKQLTFLKAWAKLFYI